MLKIFSILDRLGCDEKSLKDIKLAIQEAYNYLHKFDNVEFQIESIAMINRIFHEQLKDVAEVSHIDLMDLHAEIESF